MELLKIETINYVVLFFIPGFITYSILSLFLGRYRSPIDISMKKYFVLSIYNLLLWAIYISIVSGDLSDLFACNTHDSMLYARIFILPALFGLILGILFILHFVVGYFNKIGVNILHPIPTSWDYVFANIDNSRLLVTLADGSTVYGYFGPNSFASSDPKEKDLYLEIVFKEDKEGGFKVDENHLGMLIKGSEISIIEFWADDEGE